MSRASWQRQSDLHPWDAAVRDETWISPGPAETRHPVRAHLGKPVDILGLKANLVADLAGGVARVARRNLAVFQGGDLEELDACPVCAAPAQGARLLVEIYGGRYYQCQACGHAFVSPRPTPKALERFYTADAEAGYASTYTDPASSRLRLEQVALPKARWLRDTFRRLHGRDPGPILDVGAGGGHFVAACRELGLEASGLELSRASRDHARAAFGLELMDADFLAEARRFAGCEVVTFWAVLEHMPDPLAALGAARYLLPASSLVVAEVPRWHSLSAAIQCAFPERVARHLEPASHIHIFSDNSLAEAFRRTGWSPRAAWYFGMDAFEVIMQTCQATESEAPARALGPHQPLLQSYLDWARLSDEIVLAGVPDIAEEP